VEKSVKRRATCLNIHFVLCRRKEKEEAENDANLKAKNFGRLEGSANQNVADFSSFLIFCFIRAAANENYNKI
jgi:hypothetical protein